MKTKHEIISQILEQVSLPLFYHDSAAISIETTRTLYKAGIMVIEYTNRGAFALQNFSVLKQLQANELPDLILGIGTIKTAAEASDFIQAGADFIVAPVVDAEVAEIAAAHDLLWVPGCMTPTEIHAANKLGASLVKIFPASVLGSGFVSAIRELFPGQHFLATGWGEITEANILKWLQSGVSALGLGSKLISKDMMDNRDFDEIYKRTVEVIACIKKTALT